VDYIIVLKGLKMGDISLKNVDRVNWEQPQADKLALVVAQQGLSLRGIAKTAGVTHTYVDKLCSRACKAELKQLQKVLDALGVNIHEIFDSTSDLIS
jgi:DNA-binding phage protein